MPLAGKTVLIVDDEPDLREILAFEFQNQHAKTIEAENGRVAWDLIGKEHVDAVVSDVRMPGGDGIELLDRVVSLGQKAPPVFLTTGFADLTIEEAYQKGAWAIFSKPFRCDALVKDVEKKLWTPDQRWPSDLAPFGDRILVQREFTSLEEAIKSGEFNCGRGGFFLATRSDAPPMGTIVRFKVTFSQSASSILEGCGTIRWVRKQSIAGKKAGIGVEYERLTDATRAFLLKCQEDKGQSAFIPMN